VIGELGVGLPGVNASGLGKSWVGVGAVGPVFAGAGMGGGVAGGAAGFWELALLAFVRERASHREQSSRR